MVKDKTTPEQAIIYRLSGDYNALHIGEYVCTLHWFLSVSSIRPYSHPTVSWGHRPENRPGDWIRRCDFARAVELRLRRPLDYLCGCRRRPERVEAVWREVLVTCEAWRRAGDIDLGSRVWPRRDSRSRVRDKGLAERQSVLEQWNRVCQESREEQAVRTAEVGLRRALARGKFISYRSSGTYMVLGALLYLSDTPARG